MRFLFIYNPNAINLQHAWEAWKSQISTLESVRDSMCGIWPYLRVNILIDKNIEFYSIYDLKPQFIYYI